MDFDNATERQKQLTKESAPEGFGNMQVIMNVSDKPIKERKCSLKEMNGMNNICFVTAKRK